MPSYGSALACSDNTTPKVYVSTDSATNDAKIDLDGERDHPRRFTIA